jgi:hypothetical protein
VYVWIEHELVVNLSRVVAVTGTGGNGDGKAEDESPAPRTAIHLTDGRVVGARATKESVVRKIREAHLAGSGEKPRGG